MTENAEQKIHWNEDVGAIWVTNQERLDRLMRPLTETLLQVAAPAAGDHVLDVGCGCGELSLRLSAAVGPNGQVMGVDISRPMLARAAQRSAGLSGGDHAPIAWQEADAMTHGFAPTSDLMVSRFGVMFFDDRPRAFANLRKAMKPGGRFAFLAWRGRAEVGWFQAPLEWVEPVLPMPPLADGQVGPCALADGEATRTLLADAGFRNVVAEPVDRTLVMGESVDDAFAMLSKTGPAAGLMREADPDSRAKAEDLLRQGLTHHARV